MPSKLHNHLSLKTTFRGVYFSKKDSLSARFYLRFRLNSYIRVLEFFATDMDFGREICYTAQDRDPKKHLSLLVLVRD